MSEELLIQRRILQYSEHQRSLGDEQPTINVNLQKLPHGWYVLVGSGSGAERA
jgi:hypothetical protein